MEKVLKIIVCSIFISFSSLFVRGNQSSINFKYTGSTIFDFHLKNAFFKGSIKSVKLSHSYIKSISNSSESFIYYSDTSQSTIHSLGYLTGLRDTFHLFVDIETIGISKRFTVYMTSSINGKFDYVDPILSINESDAFLEMEYSSIISSNYSFRFNNSLRVIEPIRGFGLTYSQSDSLNNYLTCLETLRCDMKYNFFTRVTHNKLNKKTIQKEPCARVSVPIKLIFNDENFNSEIEKKIGVVQESDSILFLGFSKKNEIVILFLKDSDVVTYPLFYRFNTRKGTLFEL